MKNHTLRATSILAVLFMLFGFSLSGTAQQPPTRQPQPPQQQELQIPELAVQELDSEALRMAMPQGCKGIQPDVQTHDVQDNFNPPGSPVLPVLSPALASFVSGKPFKGYDNPKVNAIFADSFRLRNCRVCYATLEARVKHYADLWTNDSLTIGAAPFNSPGMKLISTGIWTPVGTNPNTLTFALPTGALSSYLSSAPIPTYLDVAAQDDTDFDYIKLSVWYY